MDALVELADAAGAEEEGAEEEGAEEEGAEEVGTEEVGADDDESDDGEPESDETGDDDVEPAGMLVDALEVDVALLEQADSATQARLATANPRKAIEGVMPSGSHVVDLVRDDALASRRPRAAVR